MSVPVLLVQLLLPLALLTWWAWRPAATALGYALQAAGVALLLLALARVALWSLPPWWTPWLYALAALLIGARHRRGHRLRRGAAWPAPWRERGTLAVSLILIGLGGSLSAVALSGRVAAPVRVVDIAMPLGPGRYLVAHGGAQVLINAHLKTLDATVERTRDWRGQSYAIDFLGLDAAGLPVRGWRPRNPAAYAIFGAAVVAPCAGEVIGAVNHLPDLPVPQRDAVHKLGNHVLLACDDVVLVFAHLQRGSVAVSVGQLLTPGTRLGQVGNSGNSSEPHLHLHAQRRGPAHAPIGGAPLMLRIDGRPLVRNDRIAGRAWPRPPDQARSATRLSADAARR